MGEFRLKWWFFKVLFALIFWIWNFIQKKSRNLSGKVIYFLFMHQGIPSVNYFAKFLEACLKLCLLFDAPALLLNCIFLQYPPNSMDDLSQVRKNKPTPLFVYVLKYSTYVLYISSAIYSKYILNNYSAVQKRIFFSMRRLKKISF